MAEFKDRLYDLMAIKGIKQSEIAEKTGIAKSLLSMYLKGTRSPKQDKIFLLAKTYDVNIQWLMGFDYPMTGEPKREIELEDKMNELFSKLDADDQSETLRYVEFKLAADKYKAKGSLLHA